MELPQWSNQNDLGFPCFHLRRIGPSSSNTLTPDVIHLLKVSTIFGRNRDVVDVVLSSQNVMWRTIISRRHARIVISRANNAHTIHDDSMNGIFINDFKIAGSVQLVEGDTVTFSHVRGSELPPGKRERQPDSEYQFMFERCTCPSTANQFSRLETSANESPRNHHNSSVSFIKVENASKSSSTKAASTETFKVPSLKGIPLVSYNDYKVEGSAEDIVCHAVTKWDDLDKTTAYDDAKCDGDEPNNFTADVRECDQIENSTDSVTKFDEQGNSTTHNTKCDEPENSTANETKCNEPKNSTAHETKCNEPENSKAHETKCNEPENSTADETKCNEPENSTSHETKCDEPENSTTDETKCNEPENSTAHETKCNEPENSTANETKCNEPENFTSHETKCDEPECDEPENSTSNKTKCNEPENSTAHETKCNEPENSTADETECDIPENSTAHETKCNELENSTTQEPKCNEPENSTADETECNEPGNSTTHDTKCNELENSTTHETKCYELENSTDDETKCREPENSTTHVIKNVIKFNELENSTPHITKCYGIGNLKTDVTKCDELEDYTGEVNKYDQHEKSTVTGTECDLENSPVDVTECEERVISITNVSECKDAEDFTADAHKFDGIEDSTVNVSECKDPKVSSANVSECNSAENFTVYVIECDETDNVTKSDKENSTVDVTECEEPVITTTYVTDTENFTAEAHECDGKEDFTDELEKTTVNVTKSDKENSAVDVTKCNGIENSKTDGKKYDENVNASTNVTESNNAEICRAGVTKYQESANSTVNDTEQDIPVNSAADITEFHESRNIKANVIECYAVEHSTAYVTSDKLKHSTTGDIKCDKPENSTTDDIKCDGPENSTTDDIKCDGLENSTTDDIKCDEPENSTTNDIKCDGPENSTTGDIKCDEPENSTPDDIKCDGPENSTSDHIKCDEPENSTTDDIKCDEPENSTTNDIKCDEPENSTNNDIKYDGPENSTTDDIKCGEPENSTTNDIKCDGLENSTTDDIKCDEPENSTTIDIKCDGPENSTTDDIKCDEPENSTTDDIKCDGLENSTTNDIKCDEPENSTTNDIKCDGLENSTSDHIKCDEPENSTTNDIKCDGPENSTTGDIKCDGPENSTTDDIKCGPENSTTDDIKCDGPENSTTDDIKCDGPENSTTGDIKCDGADNSSANVTKHDEEEDVAADVTGCKESGNSVVDITKFEEAGNSAVNVTECSDKGHSTASVVKYDAAANATAIVTECNEGDNSTADVAEFDEPVDVTKCNDADNSKGNISEYYDAENSTVNVTYFDEATDVTENDDAQNSKADVTENVMVDNSTADVTKAEEPDVIECGESENYTAVVTKCYKTEKFTEDNITECDKPENSTATITKCEDLETSESDVTACNNAENSTSNVIKCDYSENSIANVTNDHPDNSTINSVTEFDECDKVNVKECDKTENREYSTAIDTEICKPDFKYLYDDNTEITECMTSEGMYSTVHTKDNSDANPVEDVDGEEPFVYECDSLDNLDSLPASENVDHQINDSNLDPDLTESTSVDHRNMLMNNINQEGSEASYRLKVKSPALSNSNENKDSDVSKVMDNDADTILDLESTSAYIGCPSNIEQSKYVTSQPDSGKSPENLQSLKDDVKSNTLAGSELSISLKSDVENICESVISDFVILDDTEIRPDEQERVGHKDLKSLARNDLGYELNHLQSTADERHLIKNDQLVSAEKDYSNSRVDNFPESNDDDVELTKVYSETSQDHKESSIFGDLNSFRADDLESTKDDLDSSKDIESCEGHASNRKNDLESTRTYEQFTGISDLSSKTNIDLELTREHDLDLVNTNNPDLTLTSVSHIPEIKSGNDYALRTISNTEINAQTVHESKPMLTFENSPIEEESSKKVDHGELILASTGKDELNLTSDPDSGDDPNSTTVTAVHGIETEITSSGDIESNHFQDEALATTRDDVNSCRMDEGHAQAASKVIKKRLREEIIEEDEYSEMEGPLSEIPATSSSHDREDPQSQIKRRKMTKDKFDMENTVMSNQVHGAVNGITASYDESFIELTSSGDNDSFGQEHPLIKSAMSTEKGKNQTTSDSVSGGQIKQITPIPKEDVNDALWVPREDLVSAAAKQVSTKTDVDQLFSYTDVFPMNSESLSSLNKMSTSTPKYETFYNDVGEYADEKPLKNQLSQIPEVIEDEETTEKMSAAPGERDTSSLVSSEVHARETWNLELPNICDDISLPGKSFDYTERERKELFTSLLQQFFMDKRLEVNEYLEDTITGDKTIVTPPLTSKPRDVIQSTARHDSAIINDRGDMLIGDLSSSLYLKEDESDAINPPMIDSPIQQRDISSLDKVATSDHVRDSVCLAGDKTESLDSQSNPRTPIHDETMAFSSSLIASVDLITDKDTAVATMGHSEQTRTVAFESDIRLKHSADVASPVCSDASLSLLDVPSVGDDAPKKEDEGISCNTDLSTHETGIGIDNTAPDFVSSIRCEDALSTLCSPSVDDEYPLTAAVTPDVAQTSHDKHTQAADSDAEMQGETKSMDIQSENRQCVITEGMDSTVHTKDHSDFYPAKHADQDTGSALDLESTPTYNGCTSNIEQSKYVSSQQPDVAQKLSDEHAQAAGSNSEIQDETETMDIPSDNRQIGSAAGVPDKLSKSLCETESNVTMEEEEESSCDNSIAEKTEATSYDLHVLENDEGRKLNYKYSFHKIVHFQRDNFLRAALKEFFANRYNTHQKTIGAENFRWALKKFDWKYQYLLDLVKTFFKFHKFVTDSRQSQPTDNNLTFSTNLGQIDYELVFSNTSLFMNRDTTNSNDDAVGELNTSLQSELGPGHPLASAQGEDILKHPASPVQNEPVHVHPPSPMQIEPVHVHPASPVINESVCDDAESSVLGNVTDGDDASSGSYPADLDPLSQVFPILPESVSELQLASNDSSMNYETSEPDMSGSEKNSSCNNDSVSDEKETIETNKLSTQKDRRFCDEAEAFAGAEALLGIPVDGADVRPSRDPEQSDRESLSEGMSRSIWVDSVSQLAPVSNHNASSIKQESLNDTHIEKSLKIYVNVEEEVNVKKNDQDVNTEKREEISVDLPTVQAMEKQTLNDEDSVTAAMVKLHKQPLEGADDRGDDTEPSADAEYPSHGFPDPSESLSRLESTSNNALFREESFTHDFSQGISSESKENNASVVVRIESSYSDEDVIKLNSDFNKTEPLNLCIQDCRSVRDYNLNSSKALSSGQPLGGADVGSYVGHEHSDEEEVTSQVFSVAPALLGQLQSELKDSTGKDGRSGETDITTSTVSDDESVTGKKLVDVSSDKSNVISLKLEAETKRSDSECAWSSSEEKGSTATQTSHEQSPITVITIVGGSVSGNTISKPVNTTSNQFTPTDTTHLRTKSVTGDYKQNNINSEEDTEQCNAIDLALDMLSGDKTCIKSDACAQSKSTNSGVQWKPPHRTESLCHHSTKIIVSNDSTNTGANDLGLTCHVMNDINNKIASNDEYLLLPDQGFNLDLIEDISNNILTENTEENIDLSHLDAENMFSDSVLDKLSDVNDSSITQDENNENNDKTICIKAEYSNEDNDENKEGDSDSVTSEHNGYEFSNSPEFPLMCPEEHLGMLNTSTENENGDDLSDDDILDDKISGVSQMSNTSGDPMNSSQNSNADTTLVGSEDRGPEPNQKRKASHDDHMTHRGRKKHCIIDPDLLSCDFDESDEFESVRADISNLVSDHIISEGEEDSLPSLNSVMGKQPKINATETEGDSILDSNKDSSFTLCITPLSKTDDKMRSLRSKRLRIQEEQNGTPQRLNDKKKSVSKSIIVNDEEKETEICEKDTNDETSSSDNDDAVKKQKKKKKRKFIGIRAADSMKDDENESAYGRSKSGERKGAREKEETNRSDIVQDGYHIQDDRGTDSVVANTAEKEDNISLRIIRCKTEKGKTEKWKSRKALKRKPSSDTRESQKAEKSEKMTNSGRFNRDKDCLENDRNQANVPSKKRLRSDDDIPQQPRKRSESKDESRNSSVDECDGQIDGMIDASYTRNSDRSRDQNGCSARKEDSSFKIPPQLKKSCDKARSGNFLSKPKRSRSLVDGGVDRSDSPIPSCSKDQSDGMFNFDLSQSQGYESMTTSSRKRTASEPCTSTAKSVLERIKSKRLKLEPKCEVEESHGPKEVKQRSNERTKRSAMTIKSAANVTLRNVQDYMQRCRNIVQTLTETLNKNLLPSQRERVQAWRKELGKLEEKLSVLPKTVIAVVGATGSGKSTLMNSLLDHVNILPTSGMQACTAVVVEVANNSASSDYEANIQFLEKEEWDKEVNTLLTDLTGKDGKVRVRQPPDLKTESGIAWCKIRAVYGKFSDNVTLQRLNSSARNVTRWLGKVKKIRVTNSSDLRSQVNGYIRSSDQVSGGQFWPIVKHVQLFIPDCDVCSSGVTLVDLPGVRDSNTARDNIAKEFLKNCNAVWIAAAIHRAKDDRTAKDLLGQQFRRQLLMDGQYGSVTFICTKTDIIRPSETISELDLENQCQALRDMEREIETKEDRKKELINKKERLETEETERQNRLTIIEEEIRELDDDFMDLSQAIEASENEHEIEDDASYVEHLSSLDKEKRNKNEEAVRLRRDMEADSRELVQIRNQLNESESELVELRKDQRALCAEQRNDYCKKQIVKDFRAGLKEVKRKGLLQHDDADDDSDEDDEDDDDDDEDGTINDTVNKLKVFTVSSVEYLKITNKLSNDGPPQVYKSVEQTQIPALKRYVHDLSSVRRLQSAKQCVCAVGRFIKDVMSYLVNAGFENEQIQSEIKRIVSENADELQETLRTHISVINREVKQAFQGILQPEVTRGAKNATKLANHTATRWGQKRNIQNPAAGGYYHTTYRAVIARDGVYNSKSAGTIDFNQELTDPMYAQITACWDQLFNTKLKGILDRWAETLLHFMQEAMNRLKVKLVTLGMTSDPVDRVNQNILNSAKNKLTTAVELLTNFIMDKQREYSRVLTPKVQEHMLGAYGQCKAESGQGSFERMKQLMDRNVFTNKTQMFSSAATHLLDQLTQLKDEISRLQTEFVAELIEDYQVLYEPFWQAANSTRNMRESYLIGVSDCCRKARDLYVDARIQERHPLFSAEESQPDFDFLSQAMLTSPDDNSDQSLTSRPVTQHPQDDIKPDVSQRVSGSGINEASNRSLVRTRFPTKSSPKDNSNASSQPQTQHKVTHPKVHIKQESPSSLSECRCGVQNVKQEPVEWPERACNTSGLNESLIYGTQTSRHSYQTSLPAGLMKSVMIKQERPSADARSPGRSNRGRLSRSNKQNANEVIDLTQDTDTD